MKRIRIRGGSAWKSKASTLCLAVSMNAPNCTGENFLAALAFAKDEGIPFFVGVSDTLQTPTLEANGFLQKEAWARARALGDQWITNHKAFLEGLRLIRWAFWEAHPDYESVREKFYWLFEHDQAFQNVILSDVERFLSRCPARKAPLLRRASIRFLLNECAGKTLQGREFPGLATLYPGRELACLSALRSDQVPAAPKGLGQTFYVRYTLESLKTPVFAGAPDYIRQVAC